MRFEDYNYPDELFYDKHHFWGRVEGDVVTMGFTSFAVDSAGEIVYVESPNPGKKIIREKPFMSVESGKWVGRVYALVSGEILEVNEELEFEPNLINDDCYGAGWMVKIKMSDPADLEQLLRGEAYMSWLEKEIARQRKLAELGG